MGYCFLRVPLMTNLPGRFQFEMGPPLFMLIAYPSSSWNSNKTKANSSKKRTVLYFHWISKKPKKSQVALKSKWRSRLAVNSEGFQDQTDFAYLEENCVAEMQRVKEKWVRLIHECFLPQKQAALHGHCLLNQSSSSSSSPPPPPPQSSGSARSCSSS